MSMNTSITDIATHWLTIVSAGFTATAHLFQIGAIDAIASVLWANMSGLFTVSSLFAFTVAPNVDGIPSNPFLVLAVILAVGYGVKILWGITQDYRGVTG